MAINWNDENFLQSAINKSKSRVEVLKNIDYYPGPISRRKLNDAIKRFNLDISHFTNRTDRWDVLPDVIDHCNSISDVLRAVGLQDQGDNHKTAKRYIKEMNLSIDHFEPRRRGGTVSPYTFDQIFCESSVVQRTTARTWILRHDLIPYRCSGCDNEGEWLGDSLSLHVDHVNGINNDHRLENLRFLCPNCHSQTSTYCGKNSGV